MILVSLPLHATGTACVKPEDVSAVLDDGDGACIIVAGQRICVPISVDEVCQRLGIMVRMRG